MKECQIIYSERKDQCCPPSSYTQVNTVTVEAATADAAIETLKGNDIEVRQIKPRD